MVCWTTYFQNVIHSNHKVTQLLFTRTKANMRCGCYVCVPTIKWRRFYWRLDIIFKENCMHFSVRNRKIRRIHFLHGIKDISLLQQQQIIFSQFPFFCQDYFPWDSTVSMLRMHNWQIHTHTHWWVLMFLSFKSV